jgi:outer membrane protein OmpA-like peptidoglycan-associated protein
MIMLHMMLMAALLVAPPPNPTAQDIIDRLSDTPKTESQGSQGQTRSLRNLVPKVRAIDMNIQFEFNSAKITRDGAEALQQLSIAMKSEQLSSSRFMIEGHTDAKGTAKYNLELSTRRAQAVVDYLKSQSVAIDRLEAVGKGFNELLNEDDPLAAENRRVRIVAVPNP